MLFNNLFKIEDNWVVFYDLFSPNRNGDSIRPIAEELRKRRPDLKFFFCVGKNDKKFKVDMADDILVEKSLKFRYVCSKAKYVVSPMGYGKINKRKGQVFIQTWHGSPLKKLYLSKSSVNKKALRFVRRIQQSDVFCSQGEIHNKNLAEAFNLNPEIIYNTGLPRNDLLFYADDKFKNDLKIKLNIPFNKKVLFYCPTWRRTDRKANLPFDLEKIRKNFEDEYVILIRSHVGLHKWVNNNNEIIDIFDNKFSYNGGDYPDATHLYTISDILITDYSSALFDFAITQKPQIFYAYDMEEYKNNFGFYFEDYKNFVPGDICTNTDELIESIYNIDKFQEKYGKKYLDFKNTYLSAEKSTAAKQVVDLMLEKGGN